jgi:hypothetical protein
LLSGREVIKMVEVNYLALIIAAVAQMVLGFLWYGPLFGKEWSKLRGFTFDKLSKEEQKAMQQKMMPWYGVTFVVSLVTAYVLAHVMFLSQNYFAYTPLMTGLTTAFFMWLGFMMPVRLYNEIFGGNNWKLFGIDTGYSLFGLLAMGVVLGYLQ